MSGFSKEDIRDWAVMFSNRCRFTTPVYEPHSVEHGFKEGFRVAVKKMQANDVQTRNRQLTIPDVSKNEADCKYKDSCGHDYCNLDECSEYETEVSEVAVCGVCKKETIWIWNSIDKINRCAFCGSQKPQTDC